MVKIESDYYIKILRVDRDGKFTSNDFNGYYKNHDIK